MTMMQWKKPIRNNGGFTLVEMLVAFSCVAVKLCFADAGGIRIAKAAGACLLQ